MMKIDMSPEGHFLLTVYCEKKLADFLNVALQQLSTTNYSDTINLKIDCYQSWHNKVTGNFRLLYLGKFVSFPHSVPESIAQVNSKDLI
jgi:hypothetical protein